MNRITTITDAQLSQIPEHVNKWIKNGLSTEPANFIEAEKGVRGCYKVSGLPQPKIVLYMGSPLGCILGGIYAVNFLQPRIQVESQVRSQVWSQVESQIVYQLVSQVELQVRSQVESQVVSQVWSQIRSQILSQPHEPQVLSKAWSQYRGGNLWSSWYVYISYIRDVLGWKNPILDSYKYDEQHALNASWCWYHDEVASISDRPCVLLRNHNNDLHCDNGPALVYRDGWKLWYIDGIIVNEQIVLTPETQKIEEILNETNEEVRRVRIERYGWERFLRESNAKLQDKRRNDRDAQTEELYKIYNGQQRFKCVDPSTGRKYILGVPTEIETCEQAQNWLSHGLDKFSIHRS